MVVTASLLTIAAPPVDRSSATYSSGRSRPRGSLAHRKHTENLARAWRERQEQKQAARCAPDPARLESVQPLLWSVAEVLTWLKTIGLPDLRAAFDANDIDGVALLGLDADGLTRLGVRALKPRKVVIRELGKLTGETLPTAAQHTGLKHWSTLQPLCEQPVAKPAALPPANLADGTFDEHKAHEDFQAAVQAWRAAGRQSRPRALLATVGDGEEWTNPFGV